MSQFVTIATFTYPSDLVVIRARLEAEGIACFTRDELTAQVHNFYSNAIGGIKLQVSLMDVERAIEILKENGYRGDEEKQFSAFWKKVHSKTQFLPFVKHYTPEVRLIMLMIPVAVTLAFIAYFATIPITSEYLTENSWCLLYVIHNGETYTPKTLGLQLVGSFCSDQIEFFEGGEMKLPGFNSTNIDGNWAVLENGVRLSELDTFQFVLEGDYHIVRGNKNMELVSDHTTIHCTKSW